jgi:hypothetical protein
VQNGDAFNLLETLKTRPWTSKQWNLFCLETGAKNIEKYVL